MSDEIIKYKKMLEDLDENPDIFDPEFIANFIAIHSVNDDGINVLLTIPINEKMDIGNDIIVTITKVQMSVSFSLMSDDIPYHGELILHYDFEPHAEDEDDDNTIRQMIMDWFDDGNYEYELFGHLTDKGFSESAAYDAEIEGFGVEEVDYYAGSIANEIVESVKFILNQKPKVIFSKFGPVILTTNVNLTAKDILPHKHAIIKYILSDIKENGVHSELATTIANKLTSLGIVWPELATIKRSIDSP